MQSNIRSCYHGKIEKADTVSYYMSVCGLLEVKSTPDICGLEHVLLFASALRDAGEVRREKKLPVAEHPKG